MAEAITRVRKGDIVVKPGYDGVFGKVTIWGAEQEENLDEQMGLF